MLRCLLVLVGLVGWAPAQSSPVLVDPAAVPEAVVLIKQGSTTCAGAFVSAEGDIVTAYHCVADGARAVVQTRDGRRSRAIVRSRLPRYDLAVLHAPELAGEPWLPIREQPAEAGETISAWGHPFGASAPGGFLVGTLRWSVSQGVVSAVGPRALQITAAVNKGNSGGPVVDAEGRLLGIVSRRLRGEGLGFATHAAVAQDLLEAPDRGSLVGGSVRAEVLGSTWEGEGGSVALGARVEVAMRDRVVVGLSVARALQPTLDALRFDQASWVGSELTLGLRQRLGHGYFTTRVDLYGGAALVQSIVRLGERADLRTAPSMRMGPIIGARIGMATAALDTAILPDAQGDLQLRMMLALRWPGRLGVF